jgi:hypothetical protein
MELKTGSRWRSAVCDSELVIVRAPTVPVSLACGGVEVVPIGTEPPADVKLDSSYSAGTQLGKRYASDAVGIELLCTKAGIGSLSVDGEPLLVKTAKSLPASD